MKIKVIKRAERESLGQQQTSIHKAEPKRRRIKRAVETWVADLRERSDAESRISFEHLFTPRENPST
ncbi:MAG TPA: hypothetical protein VL501_07660 [Pyrinomonadaceae bacterium]|nr:hypothetical protein [Pyrinomonadaceae bacterium]